MDEVAKAGTGIPAKDVVGVTIQTSTNTYIKRVAKKPYFGGHDYKRWKVIESAILTSVIKRGGMASANDLTDDLMGMPHVRKFFNFCISNLTHRGAHHTPPLVSDVQDGERIYYLNPAFESLYPNFTQVRCSS